MQGLIDSTLREGEQAVGVRFSLVEKISIFRMLVQMGVEEIEIGLAAEYRQIADLCQYCRGSKKNSRIALWSRCRSDDIAAAARMRPDVLSLSVPVSDLHLRQRLRRDRKWAVTAMQESIREARAAGIQYISIGFEDATRADLSFLELLAETASTAGAHRIRLADTVGTATPAQIQQLVDRLKRTAPLAIGVHAHNDFGMATANTIAALEAGAEWGDVTVLGLGERAGMARLEEVAGFLTLRDNRPRYRADLLRPLTTLVARLTNRAVGPHHPVVGEEIFACETGLHLQGLLREPSTYEPFDPQLVGNRRQLLFGAKVGRGAVAELLTGQEVPPPLATALLARRIHLQAHALQRPLNMIEAARLTGPGQEKASAAKGQERPENLIALEATSHP